MDMHDRDMSRTQPNRNPTPVSCANHTPCPTGYDAWYKWASIKCKTHKQVKCAGCGQYTIWVEK